MASYLVLLAEATNAVSGAVILACFLVVTVLILSYQGELWGGETVVRVPMQPVQLEVQRLHVPYTLGLLRSGRHDAVVLCGAEERGCVAVWWWGVARHHLAGLLHDTWHHFHDTVTAATQHHVMRHYTRHSQLLCEGEHSLALPVPPDQDLGPCPRQVYPLVVVQVDPDRDGQDNNQVGALVSVLHLPDDAYPKPGHVMYQYLKQRTGQATLLTTLFTQLNGVDCAPCPATARTTGTPDDQAPTTPSASTAPSVPSQGCSAAGELCDETISAVGPKFDSVGDQSSNICSDIEVTKVGMQCDESKHTTSPCDIREVRQCAEQVLNHLTLEPHNIADNLTSSCRQRLKDISNNSSNAGIKSRASVSAAEDSLSADVCQSNCWSDDASGRSSADRNSTDAVVSENTGVGGITVSENTGVGGITATENTGVEGITVSENTGVEGITVSENTGVEGITPTENTGVEDIFATENTGVEDIVATDNTTCGTPTEYLPCASPPSPGNSRSTKKEDSTPPAGDTISSGSGGVDAKDNLTTTPSEDADCVVCQADRSSLALLPCCHVCVCYTCFQQLMAARQTCPLCRQHVAAYFLV